MRSKLRHAVLSCAFATLPLLGLSSCATSHLLDWSAGDPSLYAQPDGEFSSSVMRPIGTIAVFPVALVWDVVTFPAQWIWGIHPYGDTVAPSAYANR